MLSVVLLNVIRLNVAVPNGHCSDAISTKNFLYKGEGKGFYKMINDCDYLLTVTSQIFAGNDRSLPLEWSSVRAPLG
jgi:hypothetical protein